MPLEYELTNFLAEAGTAQFLACVSDRNDKGKYKNSSQSDADTKTYRTKVETNLLKIFKGCWYQSQNE